MRFNSHYNIASRVGPGSHAFLSASKPSWVNYDDEKLDMAFASSLAAEKGTRLHKIAADLIREKIKVARSEATFNRYVNDAIGFRMTPEQILYYSDNAYGTADTISFRRAKLRVHDLKTGISPASFTQLNVYGSLFCLEYNVNPFEIEMEFRIYQNDTFEVDYGDPDIIMRIMEKIKRFDKRISAMRLEADGLGL